MNVDVSNFFQGLVETVMVYLQTFLQSLLTGLVENILPF